MKKFFFQVAIFLMMIQVSHTAGHHDHVHYERPEWEIISEPSFHISGETCSVYWCY